MKTEVKIAGTWREYAWGTSVQRRKRTEATIGTKVLSKEDADRIFSKKDFRRFSAGEVVNG